MPASPIAFDDGQRLEALARYKILDTECDEIFDRITQISRSIFGTPIVLITLVDRDRQWFKSNIGLNVCETPRGQAFCSYAILQSDVLVVEDATKDPRFSDNPLVTSHPFIRFYAGAPLVTHDHYALGTLCLIDTAPRRFLDADIKVLEDLATIAMNEIELRAVNGQGKNADKYTNRDVHTNAYNESVFKKLFSAECARTHARKGRLSLVLFQLNCFESMETGRNAGRADAIAKSFRETCREVTRSGDILARVGEKEFSLLLPNTKSVTAEIVVRRILRRIGNEEQQHGNSKINYTVSVGVAELASGQTTMGFYKEADRNRRAAEETGPNEYIASFAV